MTRLRMFVGRSAFMFGAVVALGACADEPAAPGLDRDFRVVAAKPVAAAISVTSASPDSATQDTTLDVTVSGNGFESGATATWTLAGIENSDEVRTNSTRFVSSRQLVANITISANATIGKWDVLVRVGGKGGIGTEAFAVKQKPQVDTSPRVNIVFDNVMNLAAPGTAPQLGPTGIQGDSRDKNGAPSSVSEYQGAFCHVEGKIFWSGNNFGGDMIFDPGGPRDSNNPCGSVRSLKFFLSYQRGGALGAASIAAPFNNVRAVMLMAPGEVISRNAAFNYSGLANCDRIAFDGLGGASQLRVTRLSDVGTSKQWRVESEYPHMAMCTVPKAWSNISKGLHYLPVAYTITEIPYPYPTNP